MAAEAGPGILGAEQPSLALELRVELGMDQAGLERTHLVAALRKLGDAHDVEDSPIGDYLSTHPGIQRRIEAITP